MGFGLNSSLTTQRPDAKRYKWAATHCLQLDQEGGVATANYVKINDISAILNKISGAGSADIGDNITICFWVSPLWNIGTVDGVANTVVEGFNTTNVPIFSMGANDSSTHRITCYYSVRTTAGSLRNRITILTQGTNGNAYEQQSLHDDNTIIGCGTSDSNFWEVDNKGNVNSEGFTHLAMTRASGSANWVFYWNGADINVNVSLGSDHDPDPVESSFTDMVLGQHAHYMDSNLTMCPMKFRDFAIYNSALSASNIAELYNSGNFYDVRTSSTAAVAAPAVYYPFNHNHADYMRNGGDMNGNQSFVAL